MFYIFLLCDSAMHQPPPPSKKKNYDIILVGRKRILLAKWTKAKCLEYSNIVHAQYYYSKQNLRLIKIMA